jgi:FAD:protein FMN transferase
MNTDVEVLSPVRESDILWAKTVDAIRGVFEDVENRLSRFRPDSELSALNGFAGEPFPASPLLFRAVRMAVEAARATAGIFDPTILRALEAAGYDRSFELITSTRGRSEATVLGGYRSIQCDDDTHTIRLDPEQRIDLGGIGKGWAVDLALEAAVSRPDICINAGGDIAARGSPGIDDGWTITLEDGGQDEPGPGTGRPVTVLIRDAAMATSTVLKRRWSVDENLHHLIDPRTGRPSESPFRSVTAVAASCAQADVAAKIALLMGEDGLAFLEERGMHGLAVRHDGSTVSTSLWPGR